MTTNATSSSEIEEVHCAIQTNVLSGQRYIGACVLRRIARVTSAEDPIQWTIELYDFLDNDLYSNFDCFLIQIGGCVLIVPETLRDATDADSRKICRLLESHSNISLRFVKKNQFKHSDNTNIIRRLVGKDNHETTVAEVLLFDLVIV